MNRILITNDDGILGFGLNILVKEIAKLAKITVVVPDRERSALSNSLTLHEPIRIREIKKDIYICSGTPADCVRFGIIELNKSKVDLVLSGINYGPNLGQDVIYSGTVGAARESVMMNISSIAISLVSKTGKNFSSASRIGYDLAKVVLENKKNSLVPCFLNVNIPDLPLRKIKGIKLTVLGKRKYADNIQKRYDPYGLPYYWLKSELLPYKNFDTTDIAVVNNDYVSVTPLKIDITDTSNFKNFENLVLGIASK